MRKIVWVLLRCFIRACGFCITTKGEKAPVEEAPLLIFAPHTSFFDMFAPWYNEVGGVAAQTAFEPKFSPPMLRNFLLWAALICQTIIVKINDDSSKSNASKEILMRVQNVEKHKSEDETWPQFGLFPEGGISNKEFLTWQTCSACPDSLSKQIRHRNNGSIESNAMHMGNSLSAIYKNGNRVLARLLPEYRRTIRRRTFCFKCQLLDGS